ncbi:septation protein SepH [Lolliginicoccus suaedae]|uniref:septation protein SepH n=1 Tax=Lolliginicoccus suaedae TaxID=2605429 RepID=UPI0011EF5D42|nr:septation protein SepH [Lolliginicoccus suaedae]
MRELKVVGIEPGGNAIVCADINTGAKFRIPADDRLRAAANGDVSRLGQAEIAMEAKLRPREIQERIRAGASVQQIVEASGIHKARVETFAHPVLLERARIATLAQSAYPLGEDGPAQHPLSTVVAIAFGSRGHKLDDASWDAWRNEQGRWVVQLRWMAGRTENKALWRFNAGADGGTAAPLNDLARELIVPDAPRSRPSLSPVTPIATAKAQASQQAPRNQAPQQASPQHQSAQHQSAKATSSSASADAGNRGQQERAATVSPQSTTEYESEPKRDRKPAKPAMPSWEDVLLGVRAGAQ